MQERMKETKRRMEGAAKALATEFASLRTGRASTGLLDRVVVEAYGTKTPLNQLAGVNAPEPRLITVQPYDPNLLGAIEKALMESDLGLTPSNDGKIIRLPVPQLTEERRKELVKKAHDLAEHARTGVRAARRDANEKLKKLEKDHKVGQDDERRGLEEVQKLHDRHIEEIGKALEHKEKDILTV